jgi:hypothetical protein
MNRSHAIVAGIVALLAAGCAARLPKSNGDALMAVIHDEGAKASPRSTEEIERAQQALEEIPIRSRAEAMAAARWVAMEESNDSDSNPNYLTDEVEYGPPVDKSASSPNPQAGKKNSMRFVGQSSSEKRPRPKETSNEEQSESDHEPSLNELMARAIERGNASMRMANGSEAARTQLIRQVAWSTDADPLTIPLTASPQAPGEPSTKGKRKSSYNHRKADVALTFSEDDPPPVVPATSTNELRKGDGAKKPSRTAPKKLAAADDSKTPPTWTAAHREAIAALKEKIRQSRDDGEDVNEIARLETMLRLQHLLAGDRDEATKPIAGLQPAEQEYWKHQMFELADMLSDRHVGDTRRYGLALHALDEATARLSELSSLSLRSTAFCKSVRDFGSVERFDRLDFTRNQEVLLYVEVRNFTSQKVNDTTFETELQGSYRVVDRSGASKAERVLPLDKQTCANRRRDYYIAYRLFIPAELEPGAYTLELTIEDKKAEKSTNARVDFNVVSSSTP